MPILQTISNSQVAASPPSRFFRSMWHSHSWLCSWVAPFRRRGGLPAGQAGFRRVLRVPNDFAGPPSWVFRSMWHSHSWLCSWVAPFLRRGGFRPPSWVLWHSHSWLCSWIAPFLRRGGFRPPSWVLWHSHSWLCSWVAPFRRPTGILNLKSPANPLTNAPKILRSLPQWN
jgi:hypothetical protein